jgi:hypothetical protein
VPRLIQPASWREIPLLIADCPDEELHSVDRNTVLTQFKTYGAILFRSFCIGIEGLQAFVKSYSKTQIPYPGIHRIQVSQDGMVQTVATGANALPLHSELSHTPFRPDVCWFYCVKAPASGSETTLCDGSLLASALPIRVLRLLEGKMLRYKRMTSIFFLQQLFGTKDDSALRESLRASPYSQFYELLGKEVIQDFVAPALYDAKFLHKPTFGNNIIHNYRPGKNLSYPTFADGSIIPENIIIEIRKIARDYTLEIEWRDQDLLMFDNTRFMHGRRAIVDPQRTIWTEFSDVDF